MKRGILVILLNIIFYGIGNAQIKLGAYYFDGWTGKSTYHLNPIIKDSFPERKPIWGWVTSTPEIIEKQINAASDAGISFFNFCWYYKRNVKGEVDDDPKNNALKLYLKATNKSKVQFSLLVANHQGYLFEKTDWEALTKYWCTLFKDKSYVTVDGKPLITFFSMNDLIRVFGNAQDVKVAIGQFRQYAQTQGLKGVSIAVAYNPTKKDAQVAEECGFDVLTAYNRHGYGLSKQQKIVSISQMKIGDAKAWNYVRMSSRIPQIPTITLNWDPRPVDLNKALKKSKKANFQSRFEGFSGNSVREAVKSAKEWMKKNGQSVTKEKIVMIYAWNEYGEGAWLTPSETLKDSLLQGLKEGLKE